VEDLQEEHGREGEKPENRNRLKNVEPRGMRTISARRRRAAAVAYANVNSVESVSATNIRRSEQAA